MSEKTKCRLQTFIDQAATKGECKFTVGVVYPTCEDAIEGAILAAKQKLIVPLFIGPVVLMRDVAAKLGENIDDYEYINADNAKIAVQLAIQLIKSKKIDSLMKGNLHTSTFMHVIVARDAGIRTDRRISHCFLVDSPRYHKLMMVTDSAINISTNILVKKDIVQNAIDFAITMGIEKPKVALLSAVETVNESIPSTFDAKNLVELAERGEITGGILDGPLSFDLALSKRAAEIKGVWSSVTGDADIFVAPNLEAGNIMLKEAVALGGACSAGVVLGTKIPVILTSRAASSRERLISCALAKILWDMKFKKK